MKNIYQIELLFLFCALISCNVPTERDILLLPPKLVEKSRLDAQVELGIDSDNIQKPGILVMWHPNNEVDIEGYSIFRGQESIGSIIEFDTIAEIRINNQFTYDTLYLDTSVSNYIEYYYFVKVKDINGHYSQPSDTISYILSYYSDAISPTNIISDSLPIFRWIDNIDDYQYTSEFVIRLEKFGQDNFQTIWVSHFYNVWFGYENTSPISFQYFPATVFWGETSETFHTNAPTNVISCYGRNAGLTQGSYRWKIKSITELNNITGLDERSGESFWQYFDISF